MEDTHKSIKSWAAEDRPREKMLLKSATALSNAELIAILLGSGSRDESAVQLAKRIMADSDHSLSALGKHDLQHFMKYKGIGEAKAITICAALELGRRRQSEPSTTTPKITCSMDIYNVIGPQMSDLPHEEFWILCLNRKNAIIARERISSGGVYQTVVDPKLVFKYALQHLASSIVLIHNHPSGGIKPSPQDNKITRQLVQAGELLEIKVLDHVIIGDNQYYSYNDENQL